MTTGGSFSPKHIGLALAALVAVFAIGVLLSRLTSSPAPGAGGTAGPTPTVSSAREQAGAYYEQGRAEYDEEDFEQAIAHFTAAILLDPEFAFPYLFRGLAYARNGDNELAIKDLETYLAMHPDPMNEPQIRGLIERLREK